MDDDLDAEFPHDRRRPLGAIACLDPDRVNSRFRQVDVLQAPILAGRFSSSAALLISRSSRSPPSSSSWRTDLRSGSVPISNSRAAMRSCGRLRTDTAVASTGQHRAVSTDFGEPARPDVSEDAPLQGIQSEFRSILVTDNAGRRWRIRPGQGGPAKRRR
jgi:hypothetical protein